MLSVSLAFASAGESRGAAGLVGPNAVIQLAAALRATQDPAAAERVFLRAGMLRLLGSPPDAMIDEAIPARLFDALWHELPPEQASCVAHSAGQRTGDYILAHRIPAGARLVLRALPSRLAAPLLLGAIRRNAWTFAGSGTCVVTFGHPAVVTIANNPLAMPGCVWHIGVFERLFRALISAQTQVRHAECRLDGAPASRFEIDIRPVPARLKGLVP